MLSAGGEEELGDRRIAGATFSAPVAPVAGPLALSSPTVPTPAGWCPPSAGPPGPSQTTGGGLAQDEEAQQCAVCLQDIVRREMALVPGCDHAFCVSCVLRWSKQRQRCPLCLGTFTRLWTYRLPSGAYDEFLIEQTLSALHGAWWAESAVAQGRMDEITSSFPRSQPLSVPSPTSPAELSANELDDDEDDFLFQLEDRLSFGPSRLRTRGPRPSRQHSAPGSRMGSSPSAAPALARSLPNEPPSGSASAMGPTLRTPHTPAVSIGGTPTSGDPTQFCFAGSPPCSDLARQDGLCVTPPIACLSASAPAGGVTIGVAHRAPALREELTAPSPPLRKVRILAQRWRVWWCVAHMAPLPPRWSASATRSCSRPSVLRRNSGGANPPLRLAPAPRAHRLQWGFPSRPGAACRELLGSDLGSSRLQPLAAPDHLGRSCHGSRTFRD